MSISHSIGCNSRTASSLKVLKHSMIVATPPRILIIEDEPSSCSFETMRGLIGLSLQEVNATEWEGEMRDELYYSV